MDIFCSVCGEPYDFHHVHHDMPLWRSKLFQAGKGCDSCEGARPKDADFEAIGRAILNDVDDGDKMERIERACSEKSYEDEWVKPDAIVLLACDGCDANITLDPDDVYPYVQDGKQIGRVTIWDGSLTSGHRREVPLDKLDPNEWDSTQGEIVEWAGKKLCEDCRVRCAHCDAELFDGEAQEKFCSDTYDEGNSFYEQDDDKTYCIACYESRPHCAQCEMSFDYDTEMSHEGLCKECQREKDKVECFDCEAKVDPDDTKEIPGCGKLVCWQCEDDHQHVETIPGRYEHDEVVECPACGDDTPVDELYENDDKTRTCGDCANIRDRKENEP